MKNRDVKRLLVISTFAFSLIAFSGAACAEKVNTGEVLNKGNAQSLLINELQQNLKIFTVAAQKYVYENTGEIPWNVNDSTTKQTYPSFLLYAGKTSNPATDCGFTPTSGSAPFPQDASFLNTPVNIQGNSEGVIPSAYQMPLWNGKKWNTPTQYLPSLWNPSFHGVYCAIVTLNEPHAKETSIVSYYVAPNGTYSDSLNLQMPASFLAYQTANQLQKTSNVSDWQSIWKAPDVVEWNNTSSGYQIKSVFSALSTDGSSALNQNP